MRLPLTLLGLVLSATPVSAQLQSLRTENLDVVYFGVENYLVPHVARTFETALGYDKKLFDWTPSEHVTLFINDFGDVGNAAATAVPVDRIAVTISPFSHAFEVILANERITTIANHELIHVMAVDKAAPRDRTFRKLFGGKILPTSDNPLSLIYSYYTTPRLYAPSWYHEGIAVFMETWRTGGFGRALGAYDEMVFRTKVADNAEIYDLVGLASAATKLDFQVGINSYLYGTRFMSYLALTYGPDKLIRWVSREKDSKARYASDFQRVFDAPLPEVWSQWIASERSFQKGNLARLRENPVTAYRPLTERALGSVSRALIDRGTGTVYFGVHSPGQVSHLDALDLKTGGLRKIIEVKGPAVFTVSSIAFEPKSRTLFYTTNNNDWRDLRGVNVDTGKSRTYIKTARVGDLVVNPADASLWGVRTFNGISTLVRIPPPYTEWNQVHSFDFGTEVYDLDISPDGRKLVGAVTKPSGNQSLGIFDTAALLAGDAGYEVLSDFENSSPANFVFSPDGKQLIGSSFYSGVSNLYRVDLATKDVRVVTNADTGYFRPLWLADGEVFALRYTGKGFQPVVISPEPVEKVNAIVFRGQQIVDTYPFLKDWKVPPPSALDLDAITRKEGAYSAFATMRERSFFPLVEGYKSYPGVGFRLNLADSIGYNRLGLTASYSPSTTLPSSERFHFKAKYQYLGWKVTGTYNNADFYDLFGPTKRSFKGYSAGVAYQRFLIYDQPNRTMDWTADLTGYGDLETLPGYQNVQVTAATLGVANLSIGYKYERSSLGAVEPEKGVAWRATLSDSYALSQHFPTMRFDLDLGVPLPFPHSSVWLRTTAGAASGDRAEPYGNFYFGGFGNNWVDDKPYRRYQEPNSFPGVEIDQISAHNYAKALIELNLPPLVFTRLGTPSLFANWASLAIIGGGIATNLDRSQDRENFGTVGAQLDIRLVALSLHQFTLSVGYAKAFLPGGQRSDEFMGSFKIPLYE